MSGLSDFALGTSMLTAQNVPGTSEEGSETQFTYVLSADQQQGKIG